MIKCEADLDKNEEKSNMSVEKLTKALRTAASICRTLDSSVDGYEDMCPVDRGYPCPHGWGDAEKCPLEQIKTVTIADVNNCWILVFQNLKADGIPLETDEGHI